jgi:CRP/FNR family cyclic AMP-dependent transcriptional regulator
LAFNLELVPKSKVEIMNLSLTDLFPTAEAQVAFKAGQTIFKEGDAGDFMVILIEGVVEVFVHGKAVGEFAPVEVFGEMAIIDPKPRSATVNAKTDCKLARVNRGRFLVLVQNKPEFAIYIMQMLVERIRWMDTVAATSVADHAKEVEQLQAEVNDLNASIETQKGQIDLMLQKLPNVDRAVVEVSPEKSG